RCAFEGQEPQRWSPAGKAVLERLGGPAVDRGRHALVDRYLYAGGLRVVHFLERDEHSVVVDDGNRDWPVVLARLFLPSGDCLLGLFEIDLGAVLGHLGLHLSGNAERGSGGDRAEHEIATRYVMHEL